MKRIALLLLACLVLPGCVTGLMSKIPNAEFTEFSFHRGGWGTSADIEATNAKKDASGVIQVENVSIKADYSVVNWVIQLKGYKVSEAK